MSLRKERQLISSGSKYESLYGYSRAVVDKPWIFVAGTTGFDYKTQTISDSAIDQTRQCFRNIASALAEAGASLEDVVRVKYFITNPDEADMILRTAGEFMRDIRPAATGIICQLIDPQMKIEIEVTAYKKEYDAGGL